ncbi:MAG: NACHT domain-containing protein [Chloroflexi bacterium]|nr:NACHT domain-containing protein [Chloroflexota bacterium]
MQKSNWIDQATDIPVDIPKDSLPDLPGTDSKAIYGRKDIRSLPRESLLLGVAGDELPVLLNLFDPIPGPILIAGDKGSGKTMLLQSIAHAAEGMHAPKDLQFGVITPHPEQWHRFQTSKTTSGIYSTKHELALELLQSLVTWAHNNKGDQQSILLIIEELDLLTQCDEQACQNLRWLLLRGPSRRVWPIVTLEAGLARDLKDWMDFFRTRIFGRINGLNEAQFLTGRSEFPPSQPGTSPNFALWEGDHWLQFWAPSVGSS